jgi:hypothetical protein
MPPRLSPSLRPSALIDLFVVLTVFVFDHIREDNVLSGDTLCLGKHHNRDDVKSKCKILQRVKFKARAPRYILTASGLNNAEQSLGTNVDVG